MQQSPFENIFNIIGGLSEGNEKPMRHGFYNAFALFILTICCAAVYVLFLILEPFFKPLFWALLVGSILHPFKYKIAKKLRSWFGKIESANASVIVGLLSLPVHIINEVAETVGEQFKAHYKGVLSLFSVIYVLPWLYNALPRSFVCMFWQFTNFVGISTTLLINFSSSYITLTVALAYFISVYTLWSPERAGIFRKASLVLWFVVTGFLAGLSGGFQVYMFILLQAFGIAGFSIEVLDVKKNMLRMDPEASTLTAVSHAIQNTRPKLVKQMSTESEQSEQTTEKSDDDPASERDSCTAELSHTSKTPGAASDNSPTTESAGEATPDDAPREVPLRRHPKMLYKTRTLSSIPVEKAKRRDFDARLATNMRQISLDENYMKANFESDDETALYFKLLFFGCFCVLVWKHIWLLPVLMFFLAIYMLKRVLDFFSVCLFVENQYNHAMGRVQNWWNDRQSAVIPAHVRGIAKMLSACNRGLTQLALSSVDSASTCIVIVGLILFAAVATVFISIQIYSEAMVIVQMAGSVLNSTWVRHSELQRYLPAGWEERLDSLIDNAYTYGREGISQGLKNVLKDGDPTKFARVEQQALEMWDRVYQSWVAGHFGAAGAGPQVDAAAVHDSWESLVASAPGLFDYSGLVAWVQNNVGTLTAVAGNVWAPLASNVSLLAGSLGAVTSLLLCGGGALLNFFINLVVFFTTLFYLLASSSALYKPVEVITRMQPGFGPRLGLALSVAINQVFRASFKMALFYGLWTWLVHNMFGAKVVYLPSVLAAVMGAAPFLGPYLAGVPAGVDVWLQGRPVAGLLLVAAQASPIAFLDAAVYKEIKDGGHPYLTGLAIAGGIYYLGPEGAILGPLLLCCIMVVLNLSSTILRDTPAEERAALNTRVRFGAYL